MIFKGELSESDIEELATPRLRLFLSIDVVGSTAFKQSSGYAEKQGWLQFFVTFYTSFPDEFARAIQRHSKDTAISVPTHQPYLWKTLGDELVFVVELAHKAEAEFFVNSFALAVNQSIIYRTRGEGRLPISFRATAWIAGFPVGNAAIPIARSNDASDGEVCQRPLETPYDFLGPAVDLGFRLDHFGDPRRFVLSADLAYLMLKANDQLRLHYEGQRAMRGVLGGRPYPVVWYDLCVREREEEFTKLEDGLVAREAAGHRELLDFLERYIKEVGEPLIIPFINSDHDFISPPADYDQQREHIKSELRRIFPHVGQLDPSGEGGGDEGKQVIDAVISEVRERLGSKGEPPPEGAE